MVDLCIEMLHSSQFLRRIRVSPQPWVARGSATILYVYFEFPYVISIQGVALFAGLRFKVE
jgi:hypothetical protein